MIEHVYGRFVILLATLALCISLCFGIASLASTHWIDREGLPDDDHIGLWAMCGTSKGCKHGDSRFNEAFPDSFNIANRATRALGIIGVIMAGSALCFTMVMLVAIGHTTKSFRLLWGFAAATSFMTCIFFLSGFFVYARAANKVYKGPFFDEQGRSLGSFDTKVKADLANWGLSFWMMMVGWVMALLACLLILCIRKSAPTQKPQTGGQSGDKTPILDPAPSHCKPNRPPPPLTRPSPPAQPPPLPPPFHHHPQPAPASPSPPPHPYPPFPVTATAPAPAPFATPAFPVPVRSGTPPEKVPEMVSVAPPMMKYADFPEPLAVYMGVEVRFLDEKLHSPDPTQRKNVCVVNAVEPGAPSARAGLMVGDILSHWDGRPINCSDAFYNYTRASRPGQEARFRVIRTGMPPFETTLRLDGKLGRTSQPEPWHMQGHPVKYG